MDWHCYLVRLQTVYCTARRATYLRFASGRRRITLAKYLVLLGLLIFAVELPAASGIYEQRSSFRDAMSALQRGRVSEFNVLRQELNEYILAPVLTYQHYLSRVNNLSHAEISQARRELSHAHYGDRLFRSWMRAQARKGNWRTYESHFEFSDDLSVVEQCYYLTSLLRTKQREKALDLVPALWVHGESQPDECDIAFDAWIVSGRVSPLKAWERSVLALNSRSYQLARYLWRFFPLEMRQQAESLYSVHRKPALAANHHNFRKDLWGYRAWTHGLLRMARDDAKTAFTTWETHRARFHETEEATAVFLNEIWYWLSQSGVLPPNDVSIGWSDRTLGSLLCLAAAYEDWDKAYAYAADLSDEMLREERWQFWKGLTEMKLNPDQSSELLQKLAQERSYYGFLAASILDQPMNLNHRDQETAVQLIEDSRWQLIKELFAVEYWDDARLEWSFQWASFTEAELTIAIREMASLGMTYDTIVAAGKAQTYDLVDARFPMPFEHEFIKYAHQTDVPREFLFAIARQESAFNPKARSSANARGLMQLMLPTARATAARIRADKVDAETLYDVQTNIKIGSHHVAELLLRFNNNRVLAAAAYNAGQSNLRRWFSTTPQGIDTISFIEFIPYQETQDYVKRVIAYTQVYSMLLGKESPLLYEHELVLPRHQLVGG